MTTPIDAVAENKQFKRARTAQSSARQLVNAIGREPRPNPGRPLSEHQRKLNRLRSATRARGEHAFNVVKRLWGFTKVRYQGVAKNTARLFAAFALANLYMVRCHLMPMRQACRC